MCCEFSFGLACGCWASGLSSHVYQYAFTRAAIVTIVMDVHGPPLNPEEPSPPATDGLIMPATDPAPTLYSRSGTHTRPNTTSRHRQFMGFLIEQHGLEFLRSGSGILDIAGGAGGLAFELAFRRNLPCTVVDPRPMRLNHRQQRTLDHHQRHVTPNGADKGNSAEGIDSCGLSDECDGAAHAPADYAAAWSAYGLPPESLPRQVCGRFDAGFAEGRHADLWRASSMVVGMHPDEATEPIVRLALAHGKPFAVVPCCVFPNSNPHRKLADGTPVRTHAQFCQYLTDIDPARVSSSHLLFAGPNVVVHSKTLLP